MNVIAFGAHPDDCDVYGGGTAILWAALGHRVRFVSLTNGGAGHHMETPERLVERRRAEAREAGRRAGVDYVVLDHPDAQLQATLAVRDDVIRLIRAFDANVVLGHRPNDYHPDHRATGYPTPARSE
jgi:LmbE family N-acetylglucosaminyl deacetylase